MFEVLATLDVPWRQITVWQVDERVAPDGDPERNAGQLDLLPAKCKPMPVTSKDLARRRGPVRHARCPSSSTWSTSASAPTATPPRGPPVTR